MLRLFLTNILITWKNNNNNNKTSTVKTFPQNHRMVRRDLWMSSSPALIKQGHPEQVTQNHVQNAFEDVQGRWLWTPYSYAPSPTLQRRASCCLDGTSCIPIGSCSGMDTTEKSLSLSSYPPFRYLGYSGYYQVIDNYQDIDKALWASSSPGWAVPNLSASPHRRGNTVPWSSGMLRFILYWGMQNWTQFSILL